MITERAKSLLDTFPQFFKTFITKYKHPEHQLCVGDGWSGLIFSTCLELEWLRADLKKKKNQDLYIDFVQIKEKFSGLRMHYNDYVSVLRKPEKYFIRFDCWLRDEMCKRGFAKLYWSLSNFRREKFYETPYEKVQSIIRKYTKISLRTCEQCGGRARLCDVGHWMLTLCESCEKEVTIE